MSHYTWPFQGVADHWRATHSPWLGEKSQPASFYGPPFFLDCGIFLMASALWDFIELFLWFPHLGIPHPQIIYFQNPILRILKTYSCLFHWKRWPKGDQWPFFSALEAKRLIVGRKNNWQEMWFTPIIKRSPLLNPSLLWEKSLHYTYVGSGREFIPYFLWYFWNTVNRGWLCFPEEWAVKLIMYWFTWSNRKPAGVSTETVRLSVLLWAPFFPEDLRLVNQPPFPLGKLW